MRSRVRRVALFVGLALVLAGCAQSGNLWLKNESGASVIVQPAQPVIHQSAYHRAWLLDPQPYGGVPDDTYVQPGSGVRIFTDECVLITEFTFEDSSGAGETEYILNADGQISTTTVYDLMGDPGPAAQDHSLCPVA